MTGEGPKVYNPKPADQFFGKGTLNTEGPFVDVRRRVAPGLFTDIDRRASIILFKSRHFVRRIRIQYFGNLMICLYQLFVDNEKHSSSRCFWNMIVIINFYETV